MRSVVMKFGGSSVVDAAAIDRVIGIVRTLRQKGLAPVVVVSAVGGVTDMLLGLGHAARASDATAVTSGVDSLIDRHRQQAEQLGVEPSSLDGGFAPCIAELRSALDTIQRQREADPRALDVIAATGE